MEAKWLNILIKKEKFIRQGQWESLNFLKKVLATLLSSIIASTSFPNDNMKNILQIFFLA